MCVVSLCIACFFESLVPCVFVIGPRAAHSCHEDSRQPKACTALMCPGLQCLSMPMYAEMSRRQSPIASSCLCLTPPPFTWLEVHRRVEAYILLCLHSVVGARMEGDSLYVDTGSHVHVCACMHAFMKTRHSLCRYFLGCNTLSWPFATCASEGHMPPWHL